MLGSLPPGTMLRPAAAQWRAVARRRRAAHRLKLHAPIPAREEHFWSVELPRALRRGSRQLRTIASCRNTPVLHQGSTTGPRPYDTIPSWTSPTSLAGGGDGVTSAPRVAISGTMPCAMYSLHGYQRRSWAISAQHGGAWFKARAHGTCPCTLVVTADSLDACDLRVIRRT